MYEYVCVLTVLSPQGDEVTLTCSVGQTKTQRVPLKNAGNIPLNVMVATSQPTLFLVTPHSLQLQPDQVTLRALYLCCGKVGP